MIASGDERLIDTYVRPTLRGELIGSLAITEPGGGSDVGHLTTRAVRDGDDYIINGAKTYITSGVRADYVVTAARTGGPGAAGVSLIVVDKGTPGFEVSRKLDKMGWRSSDTAELSYTDVRVPAANLIGGENTGFVQIAARVRLRTRRPCRAGVLQRAALPRPDRRVVPQPRDVRQAADLTPAGAEHACRDGPPHRRRAGVHPPPRRAAARPGDTNLITEVCFAKNTAVEAGEWVANAGRAAVRRHGVHGRIRDRTAVPRHAHPRNRRRNNRDPHRARGQDPWIPVMTVAVHPRPRIPRLHRSGLGDDGQAGRARRRARQGARWRRRQVRRAPSRARQAHRARTHRAAGRPRLAVPGAEPARRVRHRFRRRRQRGRRYRGGQRGRVHAGRQRPDGQGRHQQSVDAEEGVAGQPDRDGEPAAGGVAGGVRRRRPADAEGDLHSRRADVPGSDPAVGGRHPHHRAGVRKLDRGRRLHPRDVGSRGDDQGTLEGVPGRPAAGEDGHRRGVRRRGAWRCRDARPHFGFGRLFRGRRTRRDQDRAADRGPAELAQAGADTGPGHRAAVRRRGAARHRALRPAGAVRSARGDRAHRRRLGVRRVQGALRRLAGDRMGHAVRLPDRHPCQRTAGCCSARSRRRRPSSSSWPTAPTRHCCSCTTRPATWSARPTRKAG